MKDTELTNLVAGILAITKNRTFTVLYHSGTQQGSRNDVRSNRPSTFPLTLFALYLIGQLLIRAIPLVDRPGDQHETKGSYMSLAIEIQLDEQSIPRRY